ncbi:SMP-30/gluconolactonase/LRE family protein [Massilia pseudoviolaceinigra]|uniref:SMP-30/gluconolactonase/LRE family protein n=1 Tax=Massilia pseudoviolaceinigra TaxID=3057165 RepID=UPI00279645F3|nr:SMP-30/gluconolactonase/LRE family protein [Massilia sp. CCM 9206]MDQ1923887.1 SMP-30/gluconolactonase/LRE family protein [Massilia sp. CCM 9206]
MDTSTRLACALAFAACQAGHAVAAGAPPAMLERLHVASALTAPQSFTSGVEGPAVDAAGNVYAVNFARQQTIGKVKPNGEAEVFVTLPGTSVANGIRFGPDGAMYVADYVEHTIYRIDPASGAVAVHAREAAMSQPNDLTITAAGVIYASDPDWKKNAGRVWRIDPDGKVTLAADQLGTANGIDVSPDGRTLYVNESVQRHIWAFTIAPDGTLGGKRRIASFADFGLDGMRVDVDGNLYVTRIGKGTVVKMSPQGRILAEIALPGKKPSNISFGGPDGRTAYVTEVENGQLLQFRVARPGLEWQQRQTGGVKAAQ